MGNKNDSLQRIYLYSSALLLAGAALAKFVSAFGSARILHLPDPLFDVKNQYVLLGVGIIETMAASYLLFGREILRKFLILMWLSSCFVIYRVCIWRLAPDKPCPCLGNLTDNLPIAPHTVDLLLKGIICYMLVGSFYFVLRPDHMKKIMTAPRPSDSGV